MFTEPRASASVLLLRDDRSNGLEVFLLRRHTASTAWGGVFVFPGGKLDAADCAPHWAQALDRVPSHLQAELGEPEVTTAQAAGLFVAVAREALEECGVSFVACPGDGGDVGMAQPSQLSQPSAQQRQHWQQRLHQGDDFFALLQPDAGRLMTQDLAPWSRWITPLQPVSIAPSASLRRFDTRFFVAALPSGQEPVHDNVEATDSLWLTPRQALQRWWDRQIELAPPQIMNLVSLMPHERVSDVLRCARARRPVRVLPEASVDVQGHRFLCYPGDPCHSSPERAQVGPTRLTRFVDRFEPEGGLEALLAPMPLQGG